MKTLLIYKVDDLKMSARVEDISDVLLITGIWHGQNFGMSIPPPSSAPAFNGMFLQELQEIADSSETVVLQHTPYQSELLQLHEQCREGKLKIATFQEIILKMCLKYETNSKAILADLFAC